MAQIWRGNGVAKDPQEQAADAPRGAPQDVEQILAARAAVLAKVPAAERKGEMLELVVCALGEERYAVPLQAVERIESAPELTLLPGAPPFWAGIINLRGHIYPVLDLAVFLHGRGESSSAAPAHFSRALLLVSANQLSVCLLVDAILAVQSVLRADIRRSPRASNSEHEFVIGVTPDLASILDVEKLLADPRLPVEQRVS